MLPAAGDKLWKELPVLKSAYQCPELKSFSEVLVEGEFVKSGSAKPIPVLIHRKYGNGMVVTLNSESMWRWDFFPKDGGVGEFYREYWMQVAQWMIRFSDFLPGQDYSLKVSEKVIDVDGHIVVDIARRSDSANTDRYSLTLYRNGRKEQVLTPTVVGNGKWSSVLTLSEPGNYHVELEYDAGAVRNKVHSAFRVKPLAGEKDELSADPEFLKELSGLTGGDVVDPGDLSGLCSAVKSVEKRSLSQIKLDGIRRRSKRWQRDKIVGRTL